MLRVAVLIAMSFLFGCASRADTYDKKVYLDLIVIEGVQSQYPDPLQVGSRDEPPKTLRESVEVLLNIVPAEAQTNSSAAPKCSIGRRVSLPEVYMECKYVVCEYLPAQSRIQDCGYLVRVEEWVQREWLGGLCSVDGADEAWPLTSWFLARGIRECPAMSELVMIAYMQQLVGIEWNESQLLRQSEIDSAEAD